MKFFELIESMAKESECTTGEALERILRWKCCRDHMGDTEELKGGRYESILRSASV